MDGLGFGEWLVIGLSVVIGLFFVIGNWYNNQHAMHAVRWLRRGLSVFGSIKSVRLSAPSSQGIPLRIDPVEVGPFNRLQGNLVLARRENLPMWLFQLIRGNQETLELNADVRSRDQGEIHAIQKTQFGRLKTAQQNKYRQMVLVDQSAERSFYASDAGQASRVATIERLVAQYPSAILSFSLQPQSPQVTILTHLPALLRANPEAFFQALQDFFGS